ncbi:uncharacterized protein LOC132946572 [Metopolophium dirhodum]|uniref:uncharacterized protein LOC132946572 n=1 Tax=Metopolophium dirhodum TaxID=44670 RepID=UPI00298F90FE|nr:uncharacterized protein LOC132946572 [Metopolophium dirhodum]
MDKYLIISKKASSSKRTIQEVDDDTAHDVGSNQNIETPEHTSLETLQKSYLFNGQFFTIIHCDGLKLIAQCKNCSKVIHGQKMSTGNFLSHLKHKHKVLLHQVEEARSNAKLSNKTNVFTRPTKKLTKQQINKVVFDYIIDEMKPLVTCEKPSFQKLIMELSGITDTALLPNRKQLASDLKERYTTYKITLSELVKKHLYICITADIWTANNKSFMGMTCHFIDNESYASRHSYVLGCRRMKGTHGFLNIAKVITEIMETYNLNNSKITHIVTDNATNFGKCFRIFSNVLEQSNEYDVGNFNIDDSDTECAIDYDHDSESDNENNYPDIERINVGSVLTNYYKTNEHKNYNHFCLPQHMTCIAHSLNLIATTDISKISDENYNRLSKTTFNKVQAFWNLVSRSSVASDKVYEYCSCKFPIPVITRWNSKYDATQKVLLHKKKLDIIFDVLKLNKLKPNEWLFLEEYCLLLKPLSNSLDKLQGEKNSYLGYVAPTLIVLRKLLIQSSNVKYCKPLASALISSLEKRFNYIYDLSNAKSKNFIVASISHPKFKMSWVPVRYISLCKELFLNECNIFKDENSISESASDNADSDTSDEFYSNLTGHLTTSFHPPAQDSDSAEIDTSVSNTAGVEALTYLNSKKKELMSLNDVPIVKQVFLKYNTTLPSSAPVERLFSKAIQVLTPRRNRLSDDVFEMLLCCKSTE